MISINRVDDDSYYRYKMPRVEILQEGKAGGTKTIISNLHEVASSLGRTPLWILKFMSYELATQAKISGGRYFLNGRHDSSRIQELIYDFIDVFVLCSSCKNPETKYLDENGLIMECLACGHRSKMRMAKLNNIIRKDIEKGSSMKGCSYFHAKATEDNDCEKSNDVN